MNELDVDDRDGRPWLCLAFGAHRQHQGNVGYEDELDKCYRYDNSVPNHRRICAGDWLVFADQVKVLGAARVVKISSREDVKRRRRCPICRTTALKRRQTIDPPYRCVRGHTTASPIERDEPCRSYEAHLDTFRRARDFLSVDGLRSACYRWNGQLAIQELDVERLLQAEAPVRKLLLEQ